jgi:hypothetical protein
MDQNIKDAIEEYKDAQSLEEIDMLDEANKEEELFTDEVAEASAEARRLFVEAEEADAEQEAETNVEAPANVEQPTIDALIKAQDAMQAQLKALIAASLKTATTKNKAARVDKKYKLLSTNVSWTNKPQVHALMAIISLTMEVGETVYESDILKNVIANEAVLNTVQGGKKIWNYYKGDTADGFIQHGNFEIVP